MAFYFTRSILGKRKSEIKGQIQAAEVSEPEPLEQLSTPLAFQDRMRLGKAAKLARKVRGVARVSAVVPQESRTALDTLATVEAQPSAYKHQLGAKASYEQEAKRRPIHQARVVLRDSRRAESAEGEAPGPFGSLRIDSTESKSKFYLHTMEQMLVAAGAGRTITLSKPAESLLAKRMAACVQLHDSAGEWQGSDERSKVWIEYLCTADLEQDVLESTPRRAGAVSRSSSTLGGPWFGEALAMGYKELRHLAKSFHTRGKRVAEETHDKFHADAVSIEFGFSTFVGGSKLQMQAWKKGEPWLTLSQSIRYWTDILVAVVLCLIAYPASMVAAVVKAQQDPQPPWSLGTVILPDLCQSTFVTIVAFPLVVFLASPRSGRLELLRRP